MGTFDTPDIPESGGNYMKLNPGENRFRILDSPIAGNLYWKNKKPVRKRMNEVIDINDVEDTGMGNPIKYFWALPVWNDNKVQVLEITQKTILKEIKTLSKDEDWGDPRGYDIVIMKTGEGKETEYSVMPKPAKPLSKEAELAWAEALENGFSLDELYTGGNPFKKSEVSDFKKELEEDIKRNEEEGVDIDPSNMDF